MSREQVSVTKAIVQCLCMTPIMRTMGWTRCFSKMTWSDSARVNSLSSPEWQLFTWYGNKPAYKFRKRVGCAGCIDLLYVPEAFYLVEKEKKILCLFISWPGQNHPEKCSPGVFWGYLSLWSTARGKRKVGAPVEHIWQNYSGFLRNFSMITYNRSFQEAWG